jgi:hypothetical protein
MEGLGLALSSLTGMVVGGSETALFALFWCNAQASARGGRWMRKFDLSGFGA